MSCPIGQTASLLAADMKYLASHLFSGVHLQLLFGPQAAVQLTGMQLSVPNTYILLHWYAQTMSK